MRNLLYLDYFATGEGRTILIIYDPKAAEEKLKETAERILDTQYFTVGFEFFDIVSIKMLDNGHPLLSVLKEKLPDFYEKSISADSLKKPIERMMYYSHINLG